MDNVVVQKPETTYDEKADVLRLQFEEKPSVRSVEVAESIVLDYDEEGRVVAIEIDGAGVLLTRLQGQGWDSVTRCGCI